jgi:hypothetical protein
MWRGKLKGDLASVAMLQNRQQDLEDLCTYHS